MKIQELNNLVPHHAVVDNPGFPNQCLIDKGKKALLLSDFSLVIKEHFNFRITAKKGFIYNGFSVHWLLHWFQSPFSGAVPAALFHDLACDTRFCTGKEASLLFLLILKMYNVPWLKRNILYFPVKAHNIIMWEYKDKEIIKNSQKFLQIDYL